MSTIKYRVEATGDNGYRCSCCRQSWDITEEYDTEEALIEDCSNNYDDDLEGYSIDSISIIEYTDDGAEIKRDHPNEAELIKKIEETAKAKKAAYKEQKEVNSKKQQQEAYAKELAGMEERRKFLESQLNQTTN
jgi:hypothetical protein